MATLDSTEANQLSEEELFGLLGSADKEMGKSVARSALRMIDGADVVAVKHFFGITPEANFKIDPERVETAMENLRHELILRLRELPVARDSQHIFDHPEERFQAAPRDLEELASGPRSDR